MKQKKTNQVKEKNDQSKTESDSSQTPLEEQEDSHELELRGKVHKFFSSILSVVQIIVILTMLIFWMAFVYIFIIILIHLTLPEGAHWLAEIEIAKLQSVIFSGAIGGVATLVTQRMLVKLMR